VTAARRAAAALALAVVAGLGIGGPGPSPPRAAAAQLTGGAGLLEEPRAPPGRPRVPPAGRRGGGADANGAGGPGRGLQLLLVALGAAAALSVFSGAALLYALRQRERAQRRAEHLQEVTAALAASLTRDEVLDAVAVRAIDGLGAVSGALGLVDDGAGVVEVVRERGAGLRLGPAHPRVPVAAQSPLADAVRARTAIWVEAPGELERRWPGSGTSRAGGHGAWAFVPVLVDGRSRGAIVLTQGAGYRFSEGERALLVAIAQQFGQALERARLHDEERARGEEAARRGEVSEQIIAIVNHDVRSPVGAAVLTAQQLRRTQGDERARAGAERIVRALRRTEELLDVLVDLTAIRVGSGLAIELAAIDYEALCQGVVDEVRRRRPEAVVRCAGSARGQGDPARVAQALRNLVDNGLKYGAPDRPVTMRISQGDAEVVVEVHNERDGTSPALEARMFDPFVRGDRGETTLKLSRGLGLFLVNEIVRAHGGRIDVASDASGTTVRLALPATAAALAGGGARSG
jgi:K+-sensing histidine kinase KdpD